MSTFVPLGIVDFFFRVRFDPSRNEVCANASRASEAHVQFAQTDDGNDACIVADARVNRLFDTTR